MANNRAKRYPMTTEEMAVQAEQQRKSKIYKAESQEVSKEAISKSIRNALSEIKRNEGREKVNLNDFATVKAITESYLESCAVESCFPSMSGIAMSLGYTRRNLYYFMEKNSGTETARFLTQVHDLLADILSENSLKGNANNIASIFLLKALYGYKDSSTIELVQGSPIDERTTVDEIAQRAGLLED